MRLTLLSIAAALAIAPALPGAAAAGPGPRAATSPIATVRVKRAWRPPIGNRMRMYHLGKDARVERRWLGIWRPVGPGHTTVQGLPFSRGPMNDVNVGFARLALDLVLDGMKDHGWVLRLVETREVRLTAEEIALLAGSGPATVGALPADFALRKHIAETALLEPHMREHALGLALERPAAHLEQREVLSAGKAILVGLFPRALPHNFVPGDPTAADADTKELLRHLHEQDLLRTYGSAADALHTFHSLVERRIAPGEKTVIRFGPVEFDIELSPWVDPAGEPAVEPAVEPAGL